MDEKSGAVLFFVVAILALTGMVFFYEDANAGMFTYAGSHVQLDPAEACGLVGCELIQSVTRVPEVDGNAAICQCSTGTYAVPLVQSVPFRAEMFPYTVGNIVESQYPNYPGTLYKIPQ